jgi:hypothetical protein
MGRARPLAIDNFMKIIWRADVGGLQLSLLQYSVKRVASKCAKTAPVQGFGLENWRT